MTQNFLDGRVTLHAGDSRDVLATLPDASIDSVVTDPPYALVSISKRFGKVNDRQPSKKKHHYGRLSRGFMGQQWDTGETAFAVEFWAQVWRVLKPGGHVVAFSGTRTYHRMVCAIEDAGFEIRDQLAWVYGSGFPKSHDVAKGVDKRLGVDGSFGGPKTAAHAGRTKKIAGVAIHERPWMSDPEAIARNNSAYIPGSPEAQAWQGWGTALKPAWEPIVLARKPLDGTVAANVLAHGTGAVNIDGCRVGTEGGTKGCDAGPSNGILGDGLNGAFGKPVPGLGRWPANILHDGSDEVVAAFPVTESGTGAVKRASAEGYRGNALGSESRPAGTPMISHGDSGSAARFFYSAKADAEDRIGSKHPTVKRVDLMQWLCRLITPPGGTVLDPFAGTGTTGEAAWREGFRAVLIEREAAYREDIARRMDLALASRATRARESAKAKEAGKPVDLGPLFAPAEAVA